MKQRLTALSLALILTLGFFGFATPCVAADIIVRSQQVHTLPMFSLETDFSFDPSSGTITGYIGTATEVVIPETIDGVTVRELGKNSFAKKNITSIEFNEGLQVIGEGALSGNKMLRSAIFPSTLRRIEKGAFLLAGFETVSLNEGLEYLGQYAFSNNKELKNINLPESLTQIDNLVFSGDTLLSGEFILGQALGHVGHRVFYKTGGPVTISIAEGPGSKLFLHDEVFASDQTSLNIPQNRPVMVFGRSFAPDKEITLNAGQINVRSDMTSDEIMEKINEAVLLTSGFAMIDPASTDGTGDVCVETGIDWQVKDLDLSQTSIQVSGTFRSFPEGTNGGAGAEAANLGMARLKPQITLNITQVEENFTSEDFLYEKIYKNNVAGSYYFGITGFSETGLHKVKNTKKLTLPSEVEVIENGISKRQQITGVGQHAFASFGLLDVTLPELKGFSEFIIDTGAFAGNQLRSIHIPHGVKIIENGAFQDNKIERLDLPSSILKVGNEAFFNNRISELIISDDVNMLQLDNYSFANNLIKSVEMPYRVFKTLGNVFQNNPGMEKVNDTFGVVYLYTRNPLHLDVSSYIFSSEYQKFILVGEVEERKELFRVLNQINTLHEEDYSKSSWTVLSDHLAAAKEVFKDSTATKAEIIEQVEILEADLTNLEPNGVNKKNLAEAVSRLSELPKKLYTVESYEELTQKLEAARIILNKQAVTQIEVEQALADLLMAEQALVISSRYQWTVNDFIYDGQTITGYSESGLSKFKTNKNLVLPDVTPSGESILAIGADAFAISTQDVMFGSDSVTSLYGLTSVHFPRSLLTIGNNAFRYNALTSLDLPVGLQSIGSTAFNGNQITEVAIPDTVTEMGDGVFSLNLINKVKFSKGMTIIPNGILSRNISLKSLDIPEGITEIGSAAFAGAPLTHLTLPKSLQIIRSRAFMAHRLVSIEIPSGVDVIEASAFEQNIKWRTLRTLTLNEGLLEIGSNSFKSGLLTEVLIPYSLEKLHERAFINNLNDLKEEVVVKIYTYNPAHLRNFVNSTSHELVLVAVNTDVLEELVTQAKLMLQTEAFLYDELQDQTGLKEAIALAMAYIESPTSKQLMMEVVEALQAAMEQIDGVKSEPNNPGSETTTPGSKPNKPDADPTIPGSKPADPVDGELPNMGVSDNRLPIISGLLLIALAASILVKKENEKSA